MALKNSTVVKSSKANEKLLEKKGNEIVKSLGGLSIKLEANLFSGLPDRMYLMPGGEVYFVEYKSTGKQPTARQKLVHEQFKRLGFEVLVVDNPEELEALRLNLTEL